MSPNKIKKERTFSDLMFLPYKLSIISTPVSSCAMLKNKSFAS